VVLFAAIGAFGLRELSDDGGRDRLGPLGLGMGALAITAGVGIAAWGAIWLRRVLTPLPMPVERGTLVQTGAYHWVRHPIYCGLMLAAFGWSLATASPEAFGCSLALVVLFDLKSRREEVWLVGRYPDYADYRRRTRRFVPWLY
jgi:protein-S-isoprenylcysteine O-methyltransferase Ste14